MGFKRAVWPKSNLRELQPHGVVETGHYLSPIPETASAAPFSSRSHPRRPDLCECQHVLMRLDVADPRVQHVG
jgi:hypothetical protein